jgi:hypothetical protein
MSLIPFAPFSFAPRAKRFSIIRAIASTTSRSPLAIDLGFAGGAGDAQSVDVSAQAQARLTQWQS